MQFIPKDVDLNPITQYLNVGVIGDIMDMHSRTLHIPENIKEFLKHCDLIIGNFEATITSQKRAGTRQKHEELIINTLEELFPPYLFFPFGGQQSCWRLWVRRMGTLSSIVEKIMDSIFLVQKLNPMLISK